MKLGSSYYAVYSRIIRDVTRLHFPKTKRVCFLLSGINESLKQRRLSHTVSYIKVIRYELWWMDPETRDRRMRRYEYAD